LNGGGIGFDQLRNATQQFRPSLAGPPVVFGERFRGELCRRINVGTRRPEEIWPERRASGGIDSGRRFTCRLRALWPMIESPSSFMIQ